MLVIRAMVLISLGDEISTSSGISKSASGANDSIIELISSALSRVLKVMMGMKLKMNASTISKTLAHS